MPMRCYSKSPPPGEQVIEVAQFPCKTVRAKLAEIKSGVLDSQVNLQFPMMDGGMVTNVYPAKAHGIDESGPGFRIKKITVDSISGFEYEIDCSPACADATDPGTAPACQVIETDLRPAHMAQLRRRQLADLDMVPLDSHVRNHRLLTHNTVSSKPADCEDPSLSYAQKAECREAQGYDDEVVAVNRAEQCTGSASDKQFALTAINRLFDQSFNTWEELQLYAAANAAQVSFD